MANGLKADLGPLRAVWDVGTLAGEDDGVLLSRFVEGGSGLAFEVLVRRHGPMVLRVCSQLLGDRHAAEDAFQAVFVVLARRARSIRNPERLAPWLHGVALRSAKESRSREARRRRIERRGATMQPTTPGHPEHPLIRAEEAEALHVEIARLPERYRGPVVLCDLQGLTQQEAASRLRCPLGTVAIRLKRARERLRDRLVRRGLDPAAGLVLANPGPATSPFLPPALIEATVRASTAAGLASASVVSLAQGVQMTMTIAKIKMATAVAALALGLAATWVVAGGLGRGPEQATRPVVPEVEVEVGRAVIREVRDYEDFAGVTESSRSLEIRANVAGRLETAYFPESKRVKEGELLFEIDRRGFRAALDLADARVLKAEAQLKFALAALERSRQPQAKDLTAQGQLDEATVDLKIAKAELGVAEAARDQARLVLAATRIRAPFDGVISPSRVAPGDPIQASKTVLATLEATDPMAVDFNVDEGTLLGLRRRMGPELAINGLVALPVRVGLPFEKGFPHAGKARLGEEKVDPATGMARLRARVPNDDQAIKFFKLFARVRIEVGKPLEAVLVPEAAVATDGGRKLLYVLDDRDIVEARPVKVGHLHDDLRTVLEGLKPGERVVVGGLKDVRPGMAIKPRPSTVPQP